MWFPNWLGDAIDIYKSLSPSYETKEVIGDGRTPREVEQGEGEGWVAGWWDNEIIRLHRKRR